MKWIFPVFIKFIKAREFLLRRIPKQLNYFLNGTPMYLTIKSFKKIIFSVFIIGTLAACSSTTPPPSIPTQRTDIAAYNPADYGAAYSYFIQRASYGDAIAEDNLGKMFADGRGVSQNLTQSVAWYSRAAAQHNADAELNLGVAKLYGRGTAQNLAQACNLFTRAKHDGNLYANEFYHNTCTSSINKQNINIAIA